MVFLKRKGQQAITATLMTFVSLVILLALTPTMQLMISNAALTGMEGLLADLVPAFLFIGLIVSWVYYVYPTRDVQV